MFQIESNRGKGQKHKLPQATFLDRHIVENEVHELYYTDSNHSCSHENNSAGIESPTTSEAKFSIDCTADQLQVLLEMILSFHASYKYSYPSDRGNFDSNVRLMMHMIKQRINRGTDTKNWSISKFHELLHMIVDAQNFGSHANVDAGKGEHGLKKL